MGELYSDDYASVAVGNADRLIPDGVRRLAGAAVFVGLVATMGLWSYRLGTRDAGEVPVIKAIDGPSRIQPDDPGGLQAAHQGLEVNRVLAGTPSTALETVRPPKPAPVPKPALASEDEAQGDLVRKAPAAMAERVLGDDLPSPDEGAVEVEMAALPSAATQTDAAASPVLGDVDVIDTDEEAATAAAGLRPRNRPSNLTVVRARAATPAAAERPAAKPAVAVAAAAAATPAKAAAVKATPASAAAAPVREASKPSSGARMVQLGAFDNEEMTKKAWSQLVAGNGDLLGSKSLFVERTTANARVFYRLRVAGFTSTEQTRQMCEALRARGIACIPVTLD